MIDLIGGASVGVIFTVNYIIKYVAYMFIGVNHHFIWWCLL